MRHVFQWILVALGLAILGAALMKPVYAHKALLGPDGQIVRNAGGLPVLVRDRYREFRVNWSGDLCYVGAAVSLTWAGFLVLSGIVISIRQKSQPSASPNGGPGGSFGNSGIGGGPPSVS